MARGEKQLNVRLPDDIHKYLETQALKFGSSLTSEVTRAIREKMDRERKTATNEVPPS